MPSSLRSTVRMLRNDLPHGDRLCFYALPALVGVTNTEDGYYVGIWLMEAGDMNRYEVEVFKRSDFIQE